MTYRRGTTKNGSAPAPPLHSKYSARYNSFKEWIYADGTCTKENLARSGFFWVEGDTVECYYCSKKLANWEYEDIPHEEHRNHAPRCPYVIMFPEVPTKPITIRQAIDLEEARVLLKLEMAWNERMEQHLPKSALKNNRTKRCRR